MTKQSTTTCTAFAGTRKIASGALLDVAIAAQAAINSGERDGILVFDNTTSHVIEFDLRGTEEDLRKRVISSGVSSSETCTEATETPGQPKKRKRGRPKLGVVGREVTLLPRHWEWLASQPGSASVTLRKLVDQARRQNVEKDRRRTAQESAYRFMVTMAGNAPGFEEATRALFATDAAKYTAETKDWPRDVRHHARRLANQVFKTQLSTNDTPF